MRVVFYVRARCSTTQQANESSAEQLAGLHAWAESAGHEVAAIFEDRAGANERVRPALEGLIHAATSLRPGFDAICVTAYSRLFRDAYQIADFIDTVRVGGGIFVISLQRPDQEVDGDLTARMNDLMEEWANRSRGN